MIDVVLYGQPTSIYENAKATLLEETRKAGIDINLSEINDVNAFISHGIKSVPSFRINNTTDINYSHNVDFSLFLKQTIQTILKEENFGTLPKIVVPIDFSETSDNALQFAIELTRQRNAVLKVIHAYYPVTTEFDGVSMIDPHIEQVKRKQFKRLIEDKKDEFDMVPYIDENFVIGGAADAIVTATKKKDVEFVVMGTTGKGKTMKKWFGSVSLEVIKRAQKPVFLITPDFRFRPIKNILYATANPFLDNEIIKRLRLIINPKEVKIHLVHVNMLTTEEKQEDLKTLISEYYPRDQIYTTSVVAKDIIEGLNDYARNSNIELIVMTRRTRNFWNKFFQSSITDKMAINSNIPLLIFHESDKLCGCGGECKKNPDHKCED